MSAPARRPSFHIRVAQPARARSRGAHGADRQRPGRFPAAVGFGFDVPVIVGWRSTASVVQVWAGGRGGVERSAAGIALTDGTDAATLTATRWYGGGLVGFAVGLQPLWVAFELDAAYQAVSVGTDFFPSGRLRKPDAPRGEPFDWLHGCSGRRDRRKILKSYGLMQATARGAACEG